MVSEFVIIVVSIYLRLHPFKSLDYQRNFFIMFFNSLNNQRVNEVDLLKLDFFLLKGFIRSSLNEVT